MCWSDRPLTHFAGGSLELYLVWAFDVMLWHVGTLSDLGLTSGAYAQSRFFLPRSVLLSRYHLAGMLAACLAIVAVVVGDIAGTLALGFIVGALLAAADTYLIYRAVKIKPPSP
jgi:hypothetical protein